MAAEVPQLQAWTHWCQQSDSKILLPAGSWRSCDRGAEQGDPLGPVYMAVVLKQIAEQALSAVKAGGDWCWDAWYMDDGQICLPPRAAPVFVNVFDSELAKAGGSRVADGSFKSSARLCGSPAARAVVAEGWDAELRSSCKILQGRPVDKVLGVGIEAADARAQFRAAAEQVKATCDALRDIDDPAVELALLRMCANVCKVAHLLRAVGPILDEGDIVDFDEGVEAALSRILGGPILGQPLDRAVCGARDGGFGLRRAREIRLPAFIASRTEARPLAAEVASSLPSAFVSRVLARWDGEVTAALLAWQRELPPGTAAVAEQVVNEAAVDAERRTWRTLGELPNEHEGRTGVKDRSLASLLGEPGLEDDEHPARAPRLQTRLSDLAVGAKITAVMKECADSGDWPSVRQLQDLRDPATDHTWLWMLATPAGREVPAREFSLAARLRIGADVVEQGAKCACCGGPLDRRGRHALRCAPGESTRGHNWVSNTLLDVASLADSSSVAEPRGLVPSRPGLRPADLLSSAAFGRPTALDVSIVCPEAEGAGPDPCAAAEQKKVTKYGAVLDELREEGIEYRPLVWTCWGRADGNAQEAMRTMAAAAARRRGYGDPRPLARHLAAQVGTQIWRRAACMVIACMPNAPSEDVRGLLPLRGDPEWGGLPGTAPTLEDWLAASAGARVAVADA